MGGGCVQEVLSIVLVGVCGLSLGTKQPSGCRVRLKGAITQSSDSVGLHFLMLSSVQDLYHFAIYFNEKTSQNGLPSDFVAVNQKAGMQL